MKVIILAGGLGTRLGSISEVMPKPMVEIGGKPMLWHIMKIYSYYGFKDFIICLGHKGHTIKNYFYNFNMNNSDFTINLSTSDINYKNSLTEDWNVTLVDTGPETLKGGRIKRVEEYLDSDLNMLTYGDGVSDVNVTDLISYHEKHKKIVTLTSVRPPSMFGEITEENGVIESFEEKPQTSSGLINGGFMVFNRKLLNYLERDSDLEFGPLEKLAREDQVMAYKHDGFWECADTVRDIENLNKLWDSNEAPWKLW